MDRVAVDRAVTRSGSMESGSMESGNMESGVVDDGVTGNASQNAGSEGASGSTESPERGSWRTSLAREFRTHPFGYIVLGLFVVAGPILAPFVFPQAPPAVAVIGGLAFGAYAALCAVPQKFL